LADAWPTRLLCHALQFSFKSIAYYIRRATLVNLTGLAGSSNTTGDEQKKLDVISNDLFIEAMRSSGKCALLVSEEEENVIFFRENGSGARYAVACDPIDGSSNLDAGVSVGTIFAIHKLAEGSEGTQADILKPGSELVAAGFTMYGASSQLVITMRGGTVNGFTLDTGVGEFILTHPDMRIPPRRAIYSVNEGNSLYWTDATKSYFDSLKRDKPYSARYIGSMVADAYRTLLYGGIFAYPADKKSPKGKLRILYECAPMALVFENGECCCFPDRVGSRSHCLLMSYFLSWWSSYRQQHEAHARRRSGTYSRSIRDLYGQLRGGGEGQGISPVITVMGWQEHVWRLVFANIYEVRHLCPRIMTDIFLSYLMIGERRIRATGPFKLGDSFSPGSPMPLERCEYHTGTANFRIDPDDFAIYHSIG
jgi:fructose-1,6-bisphosphatase I